MKISHVLASHAKFYTISSFCRCCCENLDEHTVVSMICLRKVFFLPEENNNPFGVSPFFPTKSGFFNWTCQKKNILLMNIDEHVFAQVSYPKRAPFLCVCLCDGLWRAAAYDCSRPWELREAEEAAVCSVALRAADRRNGTGGGHSPQRTTR